MSYERHPRPWMVQIEGEDKTATVRSHSGGVVVSANDQWFAQPYLAALVGAVNAADRALPLEQVLANLAAGKRG